MFIYLFHNPVTRMYANRNLTKPELNIFYDRAEILVQKYFKQLLLHASLSLPVLTCFNIFKKNFSSERTVWSRKRKTSRFERVPIHIFTCNPLCLHSPKMRSNILNIFSVLNQTSSWQHMFVFISIPETMFATVKALSNAYQLP